MGAIPLSVVRTLEALRDDSRRERFLLTGSWSLVAVMFVAQGFLLWGVSTRASQVANSNKTLAESNGVLAKEVKKSNEFLGLVRQLLLTKQGSPEQAEVLRQLKAQQEAQEDEDARSTATTAPGGPKPSAGAAGPAGNTGPQGPTGPPGDPPTSTTTSTTTASTTTTTVPVVQFCINLRVTEACSK